MFGHRKSVDFDFFTRVAFNPESLIKELKKISSIKIGDNSEGTLNLTANRVRLSFYKYEYPLIRDTMLFGRQRLASPEDIAAMKLVAISQRGAKKDFFDLWYLLKSGYTLRLMFDVLDSKFKDVSYNKMHIKKSLTFFEDAESDPDPLMLIPISWAEVKRDLCSIVLKI